MKAFSHLFAPLWISGVPQSLIDHVSDCLVTEENPAAHTQRILIGRKEKYSPESTRPDDPYGSDSEYQDALADELEALFNQSASEDGGLYTPCLADVKLPEYFDSLPPTVVGSQLLFWESPVAALVRARADFISERADSPGESLELWRNHHERLLTIYRNYPGQTLLIRADRLRRDDVTALLDELAQLCPSPLPPCLVDFLQEMPGSLDSEPGSNRHVDENMLSALVADGYPECHDLFVEMESCSALLGRTAEMDAGSLDTQELSKHALALHFELRQTEIDAEVARHQANTLTLQVHEQEAQISGLRQECDRTKMELASGSQQLKESKEESELLLLQLHQVQEELELVFANKEQTAKEAEAMRAEADVLRRQVSEHTEHAQAHRDEIAANRQQLATLSQNRDELDALVAALTEERDALKAEVSRWQQDIASARRAHEEQAKLARDRQQDAESAKQQLADLVRQRDLLNTQMATVSGERETLKAEAQKRQEELVQALKNCDERGKQVQDCQREIDAKQKHVADLAHQRDTLNAQIAAVTGERDDLRTTIQKLQAELAEVTKTRDEQMALAQERQKQVDTGRKQVTDLGAQHDKLLAELETKSAQLQESGSEAEVLLSQLHQVQEELERYFLEHQQALQLLQAFQSSQIRTRALISDLIRLKGLDPTLC